MWTLLHCCWDVRWYSHCGEQYGGSSETQSCRTTQHSHSRAYIQTAVIQKDSRTPVLIAALFTTAQMWEQPKYPLTVNE